MRPSEVPADAYLLDIREPDEWAAGHAPGSHHVPMAELPLRLEEVPVERDVVVVCRVGARSAHVVAYLHANGFGNVVNLDGGLIEWAAAGRPLVSEDGRAGQVI